MQYDEFLRRVQQRARLDSKADAARAIKATLQTLAEQLPPDQSAKLASRLPAEINSYIHQLETPQALSFNSFFHRVAERESAALPRAVYHARAVIRVLKEAIEPGELAQIRAFLPDEFKPLFEAGSLMQPRTCQNDNTISDSTLV